ncbi:hypothetical protein [Desulfovibrio sp. ZJ200]|uniref:hypothetical protein n=1 Tax=Desulfovibrio sp. ZJ200 TaxID=2709792 RepID=UPI0013ED3057|nr:hypothetical protein [Desulfovibrio sp. ZJ200]
MIIVDGCKSGKEISNFANLEEMLTNLMDDEKMENRVVTDVFVNNESFSEIYPHQAEDIACDSITSVEVRSRPASELAVDIAAEMNKVARMMGHGARHVARLFREASDTDALELFQDLLDVTRDFMSMLGVLRERYFSGDDQAFAQKVEKLSALLSEMSEVLGNEDWILLADLLEYEFLPLCETWRVVSEDLHRQMAKSVAQ